MSMEEYITTKKGEVDKAIREHITSILSDSSSDNTDELGVLEKTLSDLTEVRKSAIAVLVAIEKKNDEVLKSNKDNADLTDTARLVGERIADRIRNLIAVEPTKYGNNKASFGLGKDKIQVTKKEVAKMEGVYNNSIKQVEVLYATGP